VKAPLGTLEHEQVRPPVDLAVLGIAQAIPVFAFQQNASERVQEVQVFWCWCRQIERVDGDVLLAEAQL
jgi:hypothetical protein